EVVALDAEGGVPPLAEVAPVLVPLHRLGRVAEELDLHLLELAASESEVPRVDLVAERLPDLSDAERQLQPRRVEDVLEVGEDALSCLRSEVDLVLLGLARRALALRR